SRDMGSLQRKRPHDPGTAGLGEGKSWNGPRFRHAGGLFASSNPRIAMAYAIDYGLGWTPPSDPAMRGATPAPHPREPDNRPQTPGTGRPQPMTTSSSAPWA